MSALYRTATATDIALMLDWAAAEGWNPGLDDAAAFHAADPDGFFVAEGDGQPVAAVSVVNHSDVFAFLGLYLCRPDWRGRGIGLALWSHALARTAGRTVGLDGVPAQEANYARSGFALAGRTRRLRGHLPLARLILPVAMAADRDAIARLDHAANGFDRPAFLSTWTAETATRRTVLMRDGATVTGFATARLCREGCKIGPVVARDAEDAATLCAQAAAALGQTDLIVDTPDATGTESALGRRLRAQGFAETFATARMYRGPAPRQDPTLHAIATMELG